MSIFNIESGLGLSERLRRAFDRQGPLAAVVALAGGRDGIVSRRRPVFTPLAPPPLSQPRTRHRRQAAATDHLYFSVRSFASQRDSHILQVAFADDRGNVVFSAFYRAAGPAAGLALEPPEDMAAEPLDFEALEALLRRLCRGAALVGFGRVLQSGLLPAEVLAHAHQVECAWRRFLRVGRKSGLPLDRSQPFTLGAALTMAGLPPLESADAALRALAIRELWTWLDGVEQDLNAGRASPRPRTEG